MTDQIKQTSPFLVSPVLFYVGGADTTCWPEDIAEMHNKFGVNPVIRNLDVQNLKTFLKFRVDFLQEEIDELKAAIAASDADMSPFTKADETVDALIDLCVVAIGTLDAFDVDSFEAWNRVLEKNMQKNPGVNPNRPNPLGLPDMIKPKGWTAPSHAGNHGLFDKLYAAEVVSIPSRD